MRNKTSKLRNKISKMRNHIDVCDVCPCDRWMRCCTERGITKGKCGFFSECISLSSLVVTRHLKKEENLKTKLRKSQIHTSLSSPVHCVIGAVLSYDVMYTGFYF